MSVRIGIIGFAGKMGQAIANTVMGTPGAALAGGSDPAVTPELREKFPGIAVTENAEELFPLCDVVVEFSSASATAGYALLAARHGKAFVSGTTGLGESAMAGIREAAGKIPLIYSTNMSLSLVVMKQLAKSAAHLLREHDYDISILDEHHRFKKDAPSGTAKTLGEFVLSGNGGSRQPSYSAIRAGHIVGEHEVMFAGQGEVIRLRHSITDRGVFARGALQAALWLHGKAPGFYTMDDVLGVK